MANPKHVAVYVRVSSRQQDTASQEPDLKRFAAGQDHPVHWYRDKFSGKSMERPSWSKLMQAVQRGEVAAVCVWRLDRLGRTAKGLTALFEELQTRKVNLISLRDGIDLNTSAGRLMANMLASVAQYETEIRAERVLAGQAVAKARGQRWGGSAKGWRWKVRDEQVKAINEMHIAKRPITEISRVTGLSRPTIYRVLNAAT